MAKGELYDKRAEKWFRQAMASIERDIETFYMRFARENKIDYNTAKQILTSSERRKYQMQIDEYIEKGRTLGVSDEWIKELENASTVYRVTRLQMLLMQMQNEVVTLAAQYGSGMADLAAEIYSDGYYLQNYVIETGLGSHAIGFEILDKRAIEVAVAQPHAGAHFSQRIWQDMQSLNGYMTQRLTQTIFRGDDPKTMIGEMADRFATSRHNAGRLIMTESAFVSSQATHTAYQAQGVERFKFVATLSEKTCPICGDLDSSPANREGFLMEDYSSGINAEPLHPWCVLPDTIVYAPDAKHLTKSMYSGDIIKVTGADGGSLSITPNHIMLTARGWVRAKHIVKGDKIIRYRAWDKLAGPTASGHPTNQNGIPTIEQLFAALLESGRVPSERMPSTAENFKGDVVENSEIDVIFVNSLLRDKLDIPGAQCLSDTLLIEAFEAAKIMLNGERTAAELLMILGLAADGIMSSADVSRIFFRSAICHHDLVGLRLPAHYDTRLQQTASNSRASDADLLGNGINANASVIQSDNISLNVLPSVRIADLNAETAQNASYGLIADTETIGDLCNRFAEFITADDVIDVEIERFTGHVYDASSISTLYIANGYISSNCRCTTIPFFDISELGKRAARDEHGRHILVSADMTYSDWAATYGAPKISGNEV